jgi:hypothetical protein
MRRAAAWVRHRLYRRWFPWSVVGVLAVLAAPVGFLAALTTSLQYEDSPPPCYGIGWGCSLGPGSSGLLMGVFWLFVVACLAVLLAVTELFWERVATIRSVTALIVLALGGVWILITAVTALLATS